MMYGNSADMSWWMVVYSVLWFALIALAITAVVVWIRRSSVPTSTSSHALHILEERFARGEMDDDEFQRRSKMLR